MRQRLALAALAGVMLAACTPAVTGGTAPRKVTATDPTDPGKAVLSATFGSSHDLRFFAGAADVRQLRIRIAGSDLRVNAPTWCKADLGDILCTVPELPAGRNFILPTTGSNISIVAKYKRELAGPDYSAEVKQ